MAIGAELVAQAVRAAGLDTVFLFPGGTIAPVIDALGRAGIRQAFETGRGSIALRARAEFEKIGRGGERMQIVVTEIPYQVNKATLLERIADLVRGKQIEGIGDMRDESDRSGMRIVIELHRNATPEVVLNQLFRFTALQTTFGVNFLALDGGRPRLMGLKDALQVFIRFREEVILRRASGPICWSGWPSRWPISMR